MMEEGVYGGGKAGAPFDPLTFIQRPQVILRAVTWLFSVIIFGCISAEGWSKDAKGVEHCHYNNDSNACNYGVGISVIAFLASIGFIVGEYFFEQMSSVKTRKRYAGAAYLAFLRYRQGSAQAFAPSYEADPTNMGGYNSYPDATDPDGGYSQPPFAGQPAQPQSGMQQAPPY
ncbi:Synaptogyrin-like [Homarus americanus]|uniref:Synaptogyrin-like n=1 Tax=Homarus americanus TaxID=6706 RepID=A0A8J5JSG7_HOMAM|nr:Synaptogyrin-like [Homarus americanus]